MWICGMARMQWRRFWKVEKLEKYVHYTMLSV